MQRATSSKYRVEILTGEGVWTQFGPTSVPARTEYRWRRWGTRVAAAAMTLALHVLLVGSALLGNPGRPPLKPLHEGAAASSHDAQATELVSTLILLNDRSITPPDQPQDNSAYAVPTLPASDKQALLLTSADAANTPQLSGSEAGTDETAPSAEAAGDAAGRAMLFGRYLGQIKARIERAWEPPRTPASDHFDCKVQIKQNARGEVQEVTLQRCGDDADWQVSLVQAIQQASPLSAPPEDSVFTELVTLSFQAASPVSTKNNSWR